MRVLSVVPRVVFAGLAFLLVTLFAQAARADTIDFACGGSQGCTGTVVQSGSDFSSTGIGVSGSYDSDPFTLTFDSTSGAIAITDTVGPDEFIGTITSFASTSNGGLTTLDLGVDWTTVPAALGTYGVTPDPAGSVVSISINGSALSVDIPIITTPEPAVPLLLSAGMIALGLMFRRRAGVLA